MLRLEFILSLLKGSAELLRLDKIRINQESSAQVY